MGTCTHANIPPPHLLILLRYYSVDGISISLLGGITLVVLMNILLYMLTILLNNYSLCDLLIIWPHYITDTWVSFTYIVVRVYLGVGLGV